MRITFFLATFFFLSTANSQNAGSIDRDYAVNGFRVFTLASTPTVDRPIDLLNAGNGKLYFLAYDANSRNAYIGRLDSNGNKDVTFNQGVFPIPSVPADFFPILVKNKSLVPNATDTSVIVISTTGNNIITLHKFNDHGNYDPAFGVGGKIQVTLNKPVLDMPKALYLPDGKILVLIGSQNSPSNSDADVLVVRLQANGALDNTFGINGITTIDQITSFCTSTCFPSRDFAEDMIYTADGKIIVTGSLQGSASNDYGAVFRLNANGTKDASFGSGGIFTVFSAGWQITPVSIKEQGDKFLVSYNRWNPLTGVRTSNLVRYNISNGAIDGSFQSIAIPQIAGSGGGSGIWGIVDILVQQDRKINVLCVSTTDATGKPYVVRLQRKGAIDPVFGTNGITIIDTLSILPAIDLDEIVLSHFANELQGRLNLVTSCNYSSTRDVLFTRLHIGALSGLSPPVANAGPDQAVCAGSTVSIGTPAIDGFDYSWTSIPAGYNSAAANPNVTVNNTTTYILSVTNALDEVMKDSVTISTVNNVSITAPGGTNFCGGSSLTLLSTSASGNQWFKDNVLINGATNQSYIATQPGSYTVTATSATCSGTSSAVVVISSPPPATPVITAGGPISFCTGGSVVLSSSALTGSQWYKDGVQINGATGQNYTAAQSAIYTVKVTINGCVSNISNGITVTVNSIPPVPTITPLSSIVICAGGSVVLRSSAVSGNQWYKDGVVISGATAQDYTATQAAIYSVKVTLNGCASNISNGINVYVNSVPPVPIITAGGPISFCTGSVVLSSSAVTGNQWYKDGIAISGATAQNYTATQSATYTVKVTINGCASTSSGITVVANSIPVPTITAGGPINFCTGGSVVLSSSAASGNQWYKDGIAISGATAQNYTATQAGSYTVIVSLNGCTSNSSNGTTVAVTNIPSTPNVTAGGPTSFCAGGSVVLSSSAASGNQWYKDGIAISGATAQNYAATQAGSYTVTLTVNGCTSMSSAGTTVVVSSIPATPAITPAGNNLVSSASAGNQWYNNGVVIANANGSTYMPTTSGIYTVIVTVNGCASAASVPFNFTVTAINSPTLDERILIAPNPVRDQLIITYNGNSSLLQMKIVDINGRLLVEKDFTNSTTVDLKRFPSGMLILHVIRKRTGEHVQKLIVKY
jgi:uncharacterized delta-60 repeat protein